MINVQTSTGVLQIYFKRILKHWIEKMKTLYIILFLSLNSIVGFAQGFWMTTTDFPEGAKTAFVGIEDSLLFAGTTNGIWKSENEGSSWKKNFTSSYIHSMYSSSSGTLLAGGFGKVFFSIDKGTTWDSVKVSSDLPITKIVEGKRNTFFFISSGFSNEEGFVGDGIFFSNGDLKSWVQRNNGLPLHLRSGEHLAVDKNGRVYVTLADENTSGQGGLYFSDDDGLTWQQSHLLVKDLGTVKVLNSFSISISPQDSVIVSVNGTVTNFSSRLNLIKHIKEIPNDTPWQPMNVANFINWWEDLNLNTIYFAKNGDWFSSVSSPISSGGSFISKNKGLTWEKRTLGLGISQTDKYENNFHFESSEGKIFMVQLLDERVYYTNTSLLNPMVISGNIKDDQGKPMAGVSITVKNMKTGTDANGSYSVEVPSGWTGTISATFGNYQFSPTSISLKNVQNPTSNLDFVGTYTGTYFISGYVKDISGQPIAQIQIDGFPKDTFTNEFGYYVAEVPARWQGTITPVLAGYQFNPNSIAISVVNSDLQDQNFIIRKTGVAYVTGKVKDEKGEPFLNVIFDGFPETTRVDATGNFYGEVPLRWTGTITPKASGYRFTPEKIQVTNLQNDLLDQLFMAFPIPVVPAFFLSGKITDQSGSPIENISISGFPFEVKTIVDGSFRVELPSGWSGVVTPVSERYVFQPTNITLNNLSATLIDQNFTASVITDIDEEESPFTIYPNPSNDGFFYIASTDEWQVIITNATGQPIWSGISNSLSTNRYQLPSPGIYFVTIIKQREKRTIKVVSR